MRSSKKRNQISAERLMVLKQTGSIYAIGCSIPDCACQKGENHCWRGFFSLYVQAVYGIYFAREQGLPYYVDFRNSTYSQADCFNGDSNFWNYYFIQPLSGKRVSSFENFIQNDLHETYPLRIWSHAYARRIHESVIKNLIIRPEVSAILEQRKAWFHKEKVLGIQVRRTDHYHEVKPVRISRYLDVIRKNLNDFDRIFIATDDKEFLKLVVRSFGKEKILFNKVTRSEDAEPVHMNPKNKNRYQLGFEVLLDCYCLSYCHKALLGPSNISYAAFLINPELNYRIMETYGARIKRLHTLLLFHLDRLGIRSL